MDLIIVSDAANKESSLCRQTCEATHRRYVSDITNVYAVFTTDISSLGPAVETAISVAGLSDPFLLTTDTTFLTGPYDPSVPHKREYFAVRKGDAVDKMVKTLRYLMHEGRPTFDYEINVPMIVDVDKAKEVLSLGHQYHFRTLYNNIVHDSGVKMADPHIDPWVHSMEPAGPVVSVGPTALRHLKCVQWVRKLHRSCSSDQTVLAQ